MLPGEITAYVEFFKTLGVAAPLVGFLAFIYNKTDSERRETQSKFLDALQNTIASNATDRQANTAALVDLNSAIRELGRASTVEHDKHLTALNSIIQKLDASERRS